MGSQEMTSKTTKPTSDELLAQFDDLGVEGNDTISQESISARETRPAASPPEQQDQDIFAELDSLALQHPASRSGTPRLSTEPQSVTRSPKPSAAATPSTGRSSEDKPAIRKSQENNRSYRADIKSSGQPSGSEKPAPQGGGWFGGFFASASAAIKQAEAAVKEIQNNEEAQKWAQHMKGNVGALKDLGDELRSKAIPTFTSLIHTLAPPISSHECLQIHITHDLSGYPAIDPLAYSVFSRVMAQVEGGDLLVVQRGQESAPKRGFDLGGYNPSIAGWHDGPWWRTVTTSNPRSVNAVRGAVEATKLVRASAESYATEYFLSKGGIEEAAKQATEVLSETNPVRSSDIFLAIQAISQTPSTELFQAGPTDDKEAPAGVVDISSAEEDEISFAVYVHDPIHGIAFHTISQAIPQKWIEWLDAELPPFEDPISEDTYASYSVVPEAIREIVEAGGVDPREWIAEWVEETLSLAMGVVAQRYVAHRMGVGQGGINKGKMRVEQASMTESKLGGP